MKQSQQVLYPIPGVTFYRNKKCRVYKVLSFKNNFGFALFLYSEFYSRLQLQRKMGKSR